MSVVLVIQHTTRIRRIVLPSVACPAVTYSSVDVFLTVHHSIDFFKLPT